MPRERTEKKSRLPLIMTIFIAFILVTSIAGYFGFDSQAQVSDYNGYKVRDFGDHIDLKINGKYVPFATHPEEAELVEIDPSIIDSIKYTKQIYITFNPNQTQESLQQIDYNRFEFQRQLAEQFNIYAVQGATASSASSNLLIITCANATQYVPVIEFREADKTRITREGKNCIVLEALNPSEFIKLRERIIYGLYGVMS